MVFQDPYSSLNPRLTVGGILHELLRVHHVVPRNEVESHTRELLRMVGLPEDAVRALPRQFSGGQRQRVAIARAIALRPELLVADEPVSALDVSVQATILNLLEELQAELGLTLLFISHNLAVVRHLCDRVAVMYLGRIIEVAPTEELFRNPRHPYTVGPARRHPPDDARATRTRRPRCRATRRARCGCRPAAGSAPGARWRSRSAPSRTRPWPRPDGPRAQRGLSLRLAGKTANRTTEAV